MSGMDPHMISENPGFGLFWFGLVGLSKWILLGCGSVTVRLSDAIEVRTLRRCCDLSTSMPKELLLTTGFCMLNQVAFLLLACMSQISLYLRVATISLLNLLASLFRWI
jgi:hypothetical protein